MSMSRDDLLRMQASARVVQERYDSAFEPWGVRARAPTLCEHFDDYRRDLAVKAKKLLPEGHDLRKPQYRAMDDHTLSVFEPQLLKECHDAALKNDSVPFDQPLRRVAERVRTRRRVNRKRTSMGHRVGENHRFHRASPPLTTPAPKLSQLKAFCCSAHVSLSGARSLWVGLSL